MSLRDEMNALFDEVDQLRADKAALQAQVDAFPAQLQAKYDEGFAAGVASVPTGEGQYSQAQLDEAVRSAVSSAVSEILAKLGQTQAGESAQEAELESFIRSKL